MNSPPWSADTDEAEGGRRAGRLLAGKYRLLRLIGQGGMGEVYEAQHAVVGRRFAVKFLHPHLAQSGSALVRFRREAQAAGALENEHIAAVTDFDTADDGAPFLVMEYLVGESLAALVAREGPLPLGRVVSALVQVCRGLEAAHAAGIIHRDLKPDNLFLSKRSDGSDLVKILDFGIAKLNRGEALSDITRSGATLGTPFYMAPEQARGEKTIGERVDIYALGVILYELLSGQKPHPGDSYNSILAHILSQPVLPLSSLRAGLPKGVTALVERAMSSSPEGRQPSAAALAKELAAFAGREVTPIHSHFELQVARSGAATLPTPDAHTVSVAREEPLPRSPRSEPRGEGSKSPSTRAVVVAPLLLLALAGASAGLWFQMRAPTSVAGAASAAPAAALQLKSAGIGALPTPAATAPVAIASTGSASADPPLAPDSRERPAERASSRSPRRTLVPAPPKAVPAAQPSVSAAVGPAASASQPRVKFDEQNPY